MRKDVDMSRNPRERAVSIAIPLFLLGVVAAITGFYTSRSGTVALLLIVGGLALIAGGIVTFFTSLRHRL